MASRITKERVEARAVLRKLKNPLYDTGIIAAAGTNVRVNFFQAPQGQPIAAAGALKTEADTNLTQAGQLGRPQEFDIYAAQVEIYHSGATVGVFDDFLRIYNPGIFELFFGQNRAWLQVPLYQIPTGLYLTGAIATADAATPTAYTYSQNGKSSVKEFYDMTVGGDPIPLASAENFSARIDWPGGAITSGNIYRARCFLLGILYSSL
jgi:hypothetical protein